MTPLTLSRANQIVDRISDISLKGGFLKPVILSSVGASSVREAISALYLVTAETFQNAALNNVPENQAILKNFVRAAGGTGMWIATLFRDEGESSQQQGVHESVKKSETIDSFLDFLHSLDPKAFDYWEHVYSRIGLTNPMSVGTHSDSQTQKMAWWRRIFG